MPWTAAQLSRAHVEWLGRLPHPATLAVDGLGDVIFSHGTPRDDEVVPVDTHLPAGFEVLTDLPETVVCGR
ncbi:MAG: hypothetical protein ACRDR6_04885 [Pseudonocardiaceae bacterium]